MPRERKIKCRLTLDFNGPDGDYTRGVFSDLFHATHGVTVYLGSKDGRDLATAARAVIRIARRREKLAAKKRFAAKKASKRLP